MSRDHGSEERFVCLAKGDGYRLGLYRDPEEGSQGEGLEVLLRLHRPGRPLEPATLAEMTGRLQRLKEEGYAIEGEEGGWVVCTRWLPTEKGDRERQMAVAKAALPVGGSL